VDVPIPGVESDLFVESPTPEYLFVSATEEAIIELPVRESSASSAE
jgi:hypothetical protein